MAPVTASRSKHLRLLVMGSVAAVIIAWGFAPTTHEFQNFFRTHSHHVVRLGRPLAFFARHDVRSDAHAVADQSYFSGRALAVDIVVCLGLLAAAWALVFLTPMGMAWKTVIVVACGVIVVLATERFCWRELAGRIEERSRTRFRAQAVMSLSEWMAEPGWAAAQRQSLTEQGPAASIDGEGMVAENIIFMENGEWVAYVQGCGKIEPHIGDIVVGYGSDGKWYYSEFHFCADMLTAWSLGPYDSLSSFTGDPFFQFEKSATPGTITSRRDPRPQGNLASY